MSLGRMRSGLSRPHPPGEPLSESRMLKLMAYADGELEGEERTEVERWLVTDSDAVRFANEMASLGDLVQTTHQASTDAKAVASFDIADAVMAAVEKERRTAKSGEAASIVSLESARARRQKTLGVGVVIAGAVALAASVLLVMRQREETPMALAPVPTAVPSPPSSNAEPGIDVDVADIGEDYVRVFYLSNESSSTTSVVVWVDESGGK